LSETPFTSATILKARVQHSFAAGDAPAIDLNFALTAPWSVLFGPSGAGKSTVLRAIAGLLRPQAGRVIFRGEALTDTAQHIFVAPHRRRIGYLGQRSVLFPHLKVLENVCYGVRGDIQRGQAMLELFHAAHLAARRIQDLSGGETRRVLLARALAPAPQLLLLDEPFNGLDLALRAALVEDLRGYLAEHPVPVLSVTHDVSEVFALDADVIVLDAGRVKDQGDARTVLSEQREMLLRMLQ
jgi:molybdate transport system ATP-binding protein